MGRNQILCYHVSLFTVFHEISDDFNPLNLIIFCRMLSPLLSSTLVSLYPSHRVTVFHHVLAGLISSHEISFCFHELFFTSFHRFSIMPHHALAQFIIILHFVSCHHVPSIAPAPIAWYRALSFFIISFHRICNHFPHLSSSISSTRWNPSPPLPHCKVFVHPSQVSNWVCGARPEVALALCDAIYARMGISWVQMKKTFQHLGGNHPNLLLTLVRFSPVGHAEPNNADVFFVQMFLRICYIKNCSYFFLKKWFGASFTPLVSQANMQTFFWSRVLR